MQTPENERFLVKSYLNLGKSKEWPRGRKLIGNIDLSGTKSCKNIAEKFNRLSRVHQRHN